MFLLSSQMCRHMNERYYDILVIKNVVLPTNIISSGQLFKEKSRIVLHNEMPFELHILQFSGTTLGLPSLVNVLESNNALLSRAQDIHLYLVASLIQ